ncbi:TPA: ATP-binding protein [Acinetobacter baumannii]|uniref:ATP-binding protein n=1 Tax=Acinetobacter baumannii TaxID=470 RepID=UPI00338E92F4
MTQLINFRIHPGHLVDTIKGQSAGVPQAFVELIMNSIDAGASRVDITMEIIKQRGHELLKYTVQDDGKGFTKKDIMTYFRDFGTPHEEGDAHYGCFRLGRGQVLAISQTIWRSRNYKFSVDINQALRNKDVSNLGFSLTTVEEKINGCHITGLLYPEVDDYYISSVESLSEKISQLCRYVPVPVFINGTRINLNLEDEIKKEGVIYFQDDYAHYLFNETDNELRLYNRGVYVKNTAPKGFLLRGKIITKKQLKLTHGRNEVLWNCPVLWEIQQGVEDVNAYILKSIPKKTQLSDKFIFDYFIGVCTRTIRTFDKDLLDQVINYRWLFNNSGNLISMVQMKDWDFTSTRYDTEDDVIYKCEKIEKQENVHFLITRGVFYELLNKLTALTNYTKFHHQMEVKVLATIKYLLHIWAAMQDEQVSLGMLKKKDIDYSDDKYATKYTPLTPKEYKTLEADQKRLLDIACIANEMVVGSGFFDDSRTIGLGRTDDPKIIAWTNSNDSIHFNIERLESVKSNNYVLIFNTVIHEYCHKTSIENPYEYQYHGEEFYELYHNATHSADVAQALVQFLKGCDQYDAKLKTKVNKQKLGG